MIELLTMGHEHRATQIFEVQPEEVSYEIDLAKKYCEMLGFLPKPAVEKYAATGGVLRGLQNGQDAGFIVFQVNPISQPGTCRIYQAAIQADAQRRSHGLHLVRAACIRGTNNGCHTATAWCLSELDANLFWREAGFIQIGKVEGGTKRGQQLLGWALPLDGRVITDNDRKATEALMRRIRRVKRQLVTLHQKQLFPDL